MSKLISVIIPVYKVENYLKKCIESVIRQTYTNLEIILVDDGSPDGCPAICDMYGAKDSRIRVIHKANGGLSSARNAGLDIAKGDYIGFVDSDDYIELDMYERLMAVAESENADIAVCDLRYVYDNGKVQPGMSDETGDTEIVTKEEAQWRYFRSNDDRLLLTVAWNKLYKRELFYEMRFPQGKLHEDEYTTYKLLYYAEKIAYLHKTGYNYLVRSSSIMGNKITGRRFDIFGAYLERAKFYMDKKEIDLSRACVFLYMHMLCQYTEWSEEIEGKNKGLIKDAGERLKDFLNEYRSELGGTFKEKIEMRMFNFYGLYFKVWKKMRNK